VTHLVFVDAGVLIAAARGDDRLSELALAVLDDPEAEFASSAFLRLEVLPKAIYHRNADEAAFYEQFFAAVTAWAEPTADLVDQAYAEAARAGLNAADALHVAAAARLGAEVLVTSETRTKSLHRATLVPVRTIVPD